ncbi:hypothetical protein [Flavobacterium sp. SLB02]|uniref:hypothetical protein n=1 Tax=Flavobacterium sp. SLB02 TaxID=2665645 RepID=UPI0012A7841B|nr:hypothetical protein [Flavobacterium sp. SLB02]QGK74117.1 hypothetical protein GIY83_08610 [Flavobacterium sp. SLB02]
MKIFYFKKICTLIFLITIALVCQSCLVSRCKRPQIMGYIYDSISRKPIENCKVGENLTDTKGHFQLKELRYSEFTFVGYEAPLLMVNEAIIKEGYENKSIQLFNPFGGGIRKGAVHNCDTIFLKRAPVTVIEK